MNSDLLRRDRSSEKKAACAFEYARSPRDDVNSDDPPEKRLTRTEWIATMKR
jgi:hypothetical protein